ncbi:MAG TPA: patatin-like phospholipase family protein [Burkholderiales bacterium]|nr:patatin-like phospholipase family protein [Burkholderiales bacterium]
MDQNAAARVPKQSLLTRVRARLERPTRPAVTAETVLREEERLIHSVSEQSKQEGGFLALALSGGGIRSATFNLGVLQALAERRLLSKLDYLSTVSGGGYIGSWLSALTVREKGIEAVELKLDPRYQASRNGKEPSAVQFLRRFSNYLTPRTGVLSSDTLSGVATYVRNLLLTQAMIIGVFALALLIPRVIPWLAQLPLFKHVALCIFALFIAAVFINLNLSRELIEKGSKPPGFAQQPAVLWLIVVPLILAAWLVSVQLLPASADKRDIIESIVFAVLAFAAVWVLAWLLVEFLLAPALMRRAKGSAKGANHNVRADGADENGMRKRLREASIVLSSLIVALAVGVGLIVFVRNTLQESFGSATLIWHWTVWGVPILLGVFGISSILLIGLVGRQLAEEDREWWSRLGAWLIAGAVGWLVLSAASIYGPFAIILAHGWIKGLSLTWVVSTVSGVLLGKSKATGGQGTNRWLDLTTEVTPYIFVAGLLLALSYGIHVGVIALFDPDYPDYPNGASAWSVALRSAEQLALAGSSFLQYAGVLNAILAQPVLSMPLSSLLLVLALAFIAVLLIVRVDINLFSFHMFYRNRLVRCYLGASNRNRQPHPFTGFDPDDNVKLTELPARPFQIVGTAINLTKVNNLAWQERKAASFVLTRLHCGYELPMIEPGKAGEPGELGESEKFGYQRTADYLKGKGWLSLGQALTISGAAVSPNQGYHSSKAVAFLLTVFNVRLGWWMQNPAKPGAWGTPGPRFGLQYLLSEVFGLADEDSEFVYLSDGGHFENLGIYELVRRRCRFIIAIDAGMDPKFGFEDLGNAVRKCQVDFGVRIDIDTKASVPMQGTGKSMYHCGVGRIHYEEADPTAIAGFLLYIKPSLTGNEPVDIMQYASVHPEFPHQSTTDQWFDESQFEAYRKLGYYIATTVLEKSALERRPGELRPLLDIFVDLGRRWYRPSARVEANFTKHAERLMHLQDTMREQSALRFLDRQLFPEWDYLMGEGKPQVDTSLWLPADPEELRAGFYFCLNLLELMQDVYLDLNLDEEWQHPDNRGWMNLFKHFSWAGMVRATYAVVRSNHGARFQRFCEVRLELPGGDVTIFKDFDRQGTTADELKTWTQQLVDAGDINFVEAEIVRAFDSAELATPKEVTPRFDRLHVLRLLVPGIRRGKADTSTKSQLLFPVGVALTQGNVIVCFRVQDHLRNMGLGRQALRLLYKQYDELRIDKDSPDAGRIVYLFDSIKGKKGTAVSGPTRPHRTGEPT